MGTAIRKSLVPAAVMALVAAPVIGTPEVITEAIFFIAGFVSAMVLLVAFWRLAPVASWVPWKQRLAMWFIAAGGATIGCVLMLSPVISPVIFRR